MEILFFTHYFPPEVNAPARRTFEHALEWVKAGHQVTVITNHPNHPTGILHEGYQNRFRSEETVSGIRVIRVKSYLAANKGFGGRILNYLTYAVMSFVIGLGTRKPELIVGTTPQFFCALSAMVLSWFKRRPFILEVRDLWPESILAVGAIKNPLIIKSLEGLESTLYNAATCIFYNSPGFKTHIADRLKTSIPMHYAPNGILLSEWARRLQLQADLPITFAQGQRHIAYVGTLGMAHGLKTVIDAAALLKDKPYCFHLIGGGAERGMLETEIRQRGLSNIVLHGIVPNEQIPLVLDQMSLLLVSLKNDPVFDTVIPSKIYEAMAAERPVVAAVGAQAAQLIEGIGMGLAVPPEHAQDMADAVQRLLEDPALYQACAKAGRNALQAQYSREQIAKQMAQVMQEVLI